MSDYRKIGEFLSPGPWFKQEQRRIIIADHRGVCIVSPREWKKIWGLQHKNNWERHRAA